jgi:predicted DNA-binding transcriptional regulator YafY
MSNVQRIIASAIHNRRRLFIRYNGQANARLIEPHVLYRTTEGIFALVAYQVRGYQSSVRRGTFWRPFQLDRIDSISVTDETFLPRIRQGYETVVALMRGETLAKLVASPEEYGATQQGAPRGKTSPADLPRPAQTKQRNSDQRSLHAN